MIFFVFSIDIGGKVLTNHLKEVISYRSVLTIWFSCDKGGGICFCPCSFVWMSVCLWARLLKNDCMDFHEMLRVDRCGDIDELINFWARSGLLRRENRMYRYMCRSQQRRMVLCTTSCGNNFVGGTCVPQSVILVLFLFTTHLAKFVMFFQ